MITGEFLTRSLSKTIRGDRRTDLVHREVTYFVDSSEEGWPEEEVSLVICALLRAQELPDMTILGESIELKRVPKIFWGQDGDPLEWDDLVSKSRESLKS